jgi:phosphonatase-like hydrolase
MGLPKRAAISLLIEEYRRTADLRPCVEEIHRDFVRRSTAFYASDPSVREVPGAPDVFDRLRSEGIRVALNAGFDRAISDVILGRLGWLERIAGSIASNEVDRGRPYPDMIRELMGRFEVSSPSRVAKAGDTPADLEEGQNAGSGLIVAVTSGTRAGNWSPSPTPISSRTSASFPACVDSRLVWTSNRRGRRQVR